MMTDRYFVRDNMTGDFGVMPKEDKERLEAEVIANNDEARFDFIALTNAEYMVLVKVGFGML